jgi:hypothetical protein
MANFDELADKGVRKLSDKRDQMIKHWNSAKERMKSNYEKVGFGPDTTDAYRRAIDSAKYPGSNPEKWKTNWVANVSR